MTTIACKYSRSLGAAAAVLIGELWAAQVDAADYDVGPIHIAQPWARATPKGAKSGAGYLTITNNGSMADRLSCVSSDASANCQVHTMTMEDGVMKMRPAEGGLEIKPGEIAAGDSAAGQQFFCSACHATELGVNKIGPSLAGVVGRKSGSAPDFKYSPALKEANITWDEKTLDQFLQNPTGDVHGSRMFLTVLNVRQQLFLPQG